MRDSIVEDLIRADFALHRKEEQRSAAAWDALATTAVLAAVAAAGWLMLAVPQ